MFTSWSKRVQGLNQSFTLRQEVSGLGYILRLLFSLHSRETVVVLVDSPIQRVVLATTVKTTMPRQVSHRPIKWQSRLWSQRCTEVNGSHCFDNSLLRPVGIQIATKSLPGPANVEHLKTIGVKTTFSCMNHTVSTVWGLPVFQNLNYKLQRRLSDVLSIQQKRHQKPSQTIQKVF